MDLPTLWVVEVTPESERHPAALLLLDDFSNTVAVLVSGKGAKAVAEEIARRCNA